MDVTRCPDCGAPAEITDRLVLESTDGPIEHARVYCAGRHWFLLSVETLERTHRRLDRTADRPVSTPAGRPDRNRP